MHGDEHLHLCQGDYLRNILYTQSTQNCLIILYEKSIGLLTFIGGTSIIPYHVYGKDCPGAIKLQKSNLKHWKSFQIRYKNRGQITLQFEPITKYERYTCRMSPTS
jgi:hypothetical protein